VSDIFCDDKRQIEKKLFTFTIGDLVKIPIFIQIAFIPPPIRKRYQIRPDDYLVWLDDGQTIKVIPVAADAIRALRGGRRGERLVERLLETRREDRQRESSPLSV
jgi:hypothetical protein